MKRKILVTTVALATLALTACHRHPNRVDYMDDGSSRTYTTRTGYRDGIDGDYGYGTGAGNDYGINNAYRDGYGNRSNIDDTYYDSYSNDNAYRTRDGYDASSRRNLGVSRSDDGFTTDPHYSYVNQLGFTNIANTAGSSYHNRYRLDSRNAADNEIFHGWRHTWVEPNDYIDEDIDVYRYTADYNGQNRTVHILSHRGTPIGGYHFGEGETVENARMINHDGYTSRIANDFRSTWDNVFNIRH